MSHEERRRLLSEIDAYRDELRKKGPTELQKLCDEERAKEMAEILAKREGEERERFFNQPHAKADLSYWSKTAHWTLDEAIALSFGKAPERVSWEKVKPYLQVSSFAFQYQRRRDLALRAVVWKQLFDPVLPGIFLAWAKRTDLAVPPELEAAVTARGVQIADWKSMYDDLKAQFDEHRKKFDEHHEQWLALSNKKSQHIDSLREQIEELQTRLADTPGPAPPTVSEKSLGARERESLLKLVIGMALGGYGYDPTAARSPQPSAIESDLASHGLVLDVDTIRKWLKEAADLLPPQQTT